MVVYNPCHLLPEPEVSYDGATPLSTHWKLVSAILKKYSSFGQTLGAKLMRTFSASSPFWWKTSFPREKHPQYSYSNISSKSLETTLFAVLHCAPGFKNNQWHKQSVQSSKLSWASLTYQGCQQLTKSKNKNTPKTNSSYLTGSLPKRKLVFQPSIPRCELLV